MATSQCFENPQSLSSTCGSGNLQEIGGLKTYVTGPQDSKLAILLISDVFGYEAPNLRKLANKVAAEGFLVVVPDFFYGEPFNLNNPNMDRESWRKAHGVDKGFEDAKPVISALRSKGVTSIGAAGFCWGGVVVVKLARTDEIQAAVVLHPGCITEDEIKGKFHTSQAHNLYVCVSVTDSLFLQRLSAQFQYWEPRLTRYLHLNN
ncbi:hypothetical protein CsSME_00033400 [Camellia sinensis var. sinensis]